MSVYLNQALDFELKIQNPGFYFYDLSPLKLHNGQVWSLDENHQQTVFSPDGRELWSVRGTNGTINSFPTKHVGKEGVGA